jgi:hypothetical protein
MMSNNKLQDDGVKKCHLPTQMLINEDLPTNKVLLAKMREAGYYTITEFSAKLRITRSYLSQVLHYKLNPDTDLRLRIAKALDCDSLIIFPLEDEKRYI